jgi:peptide methionine sulfoxide reductase MsrA
MQHVRLRKYMLFAAGRIPLTNSLMCRSAIVTPVTAAGRFYPAEDYHQHYFEKNPGQGYCRAVVAPKVEKAKAHFSEQLK